MLPVSHIYWHWHSSLIPDLIAIMHVLRELVRVHECVISVSIFDDFTVKQLI